MLARKGIIRTGDGECHMRPCTGETLRDQGEN